MGHIAEAEVESGRIFAQRLVRSPYLKSWDASWPDSGRGIAELRSARKYGGLNQRYFDSTSPPIEPRCTAADCAEVGLGSLGRRLREHCSGKPLLRPSSALVGKPVPVVMVNSMCLGNYDPRAGGLFLGAWRWRERHDGRPQRVPARSLRPETSKLISV